MWDSETGKAVVKWQEYSEIINTACRCPDGERVISE